MAVAVRYTAVLESSVSGPLNPALVDFTFNSPDAVTIPYMVARVIVYIATACANLSETDTYITGVNRQELPGGPVLGNAFPATEYAACLAAAVPGLASTAMTGWASTALGLSGATSSGRGDSACINTRAPAAGKHGRGRHFIPFLSRTAVGTDGLLDTGILTDVAQAYVDCFSGGAAAPFNVDMEPVVFSRTLGTTSPITTLNPQRIPSRLRSRTR
jgi:hypothetical protein